MSGVGQWHLLGCKIIRRIDLDKGGCGCPNHTSVELREKLDRAKALMTKAGLIMVRQNPHAGADGHAVALELKAFVDADGEELPF